jgi:hypothetical protein
MNYSVSISDVATASGVNKSTVSRVLNGKAATCRICPTTQNRIRTVARQLGYQRNPSTRYAVAVGKPSPATILTPQIQQRQIGLVLSPDSQANTLALIPGVEPVLSTADYRLVVMTLPADPNTAQAKITRLMHESAGILCCPTIYPNVSAMVNKASPTYPTVPWQSRVIILWQGAAKAILSAVSAPQEDAPSANSGQFVVNSNQSAGLGVPQKPIETPVITVAPATPKPTITPEPVSPQEPAPLPQPEPVTVSSPVVPETPTITPEPAVAVEPTPEPVPEPMQTQEPIIIPESVIAIPEPVVGETPAPFITPEPAPLPQPEPVTASPPVMPEPPTITPEPVVTATPPPEPMPEPVQPQEPIVIPEPVIVDTPAPVVTPEPVPLPQPEPVTASSPVAPETPIITPEPSVTAEPTPEPIPEPEQPQAPIVVPEPVIAIPEPVIAETPAPVIATEQTPELVQETAQIATAEQAEGTPQETTQAP